MSYDWGNSPNLHLKLPFIIQPSVKKNQWWWILNFHQYTFGSEHKHKHGKKETKYSNMLLLQMSDKYNYVIILPKVAARMNDPVSSSFLSHLLFH